jgi:hypothetical protein
MDFRPSIHAHKSGRLKFPPSKEHEKKDALLLREKSERQMTRTESLNPADFLKNRKKQSLRKIKNIQFTFDFSH